MQKSVASTKLKPIFRPFRVKSLELPNRVVMSPMGRGFGRNGVPDERYPEYFRRRVEGGSGLVVIGATAINHPSAPWDEHEPHFHGVTALVVWEASARAVHEAGGRIIPQIWHRRGGRQRHASNELLR